MAKQASKSRKSSKPAPSVSVAEVLHVALLGVLWGFVESADASQSRSKSAMVALESAYKALSAEEFAAMVAAEFGNGERGKANIKGALIDALEARCKAEGKPVPVSARGFVSQVRTVALNFGNADVRKAASESGTRAAYDAAKPKAATEGEKAAPVKAAPVTTLADMIGEVIKAGGIGGLVHVAQVMKSACLSQKDTIRANLCAEFAAKLAA